MRYYSTEHEVALHFVISIILSNTNFFFPLLGTANFLLKNFNLPIQPKLTIVNNSLYALLRNA